MGPPKPKAKKASAPPAVVPKTNGPKPTHDPVGGSYQAAPSHAPNPGAAKPEPKVPPKFAPGEQFISMPTPTARTLTKRGKIPTMKIRHK